MSKHNQGEITHRQESPLQPYAVHLETAGVPLQEVPAEIHQAVAAEVDKLRKLHKLVEPIAAAIVNAEREEQVKTTNINDTLKQWAEKRGVTV